MKRTLLILIALFGILARTNGQSILVNRYFNSGTGDGVGDVVELVVVNDGLDIRKWIIKDYANGTSTLDEGGAKLRFKNIPLWSNLKSGTTIVLRKLSVADLATYTPDTDPSDFKINLAINDAAFMEDLVPAKAWNLTPHEVVVIRADTDDLPSPPGLLVDNANKAVHALGYGDIVSKATWNGIKSPKSVFNNGVYNTTNYVANGTVGVVSLTNPNVADYTVPVDINTALVQLPSYWNKDVSLMTGMPYGLEVYKTTADFSVNGGLARKMNAYAVILDPRLVDLKPTMSATSKTPQAYSLDEPGTVYACLNGGFFSASTSLSMLKYDGTVSANNVASLNRSVYNGVTSVYYPTRAAFGISPSLKPNVSWVYPVLTGSTRTVYSYPAPAPNNVNEAPQPIPTVTGGEIWNVSSAIGGSPMLVKDGEIRMTATEELADLDNTSLRARSAIGYTESGKVVLLAVEGGNTGTGVLGLTLLELAQLMKEMGCVGAINLDGGGSTALRVNGLPTVKPSDGGNERTMPGVILIKSKN